MISISTISVIFTWSLFAVFASAVAPVKDTLYYDLLGVNPYCVVTCIQHRCEYFPLPDSLWFVYQKEEALRLHQIKEEVCQILLDNDSRREYDREGPKLNFTINEFSQIIIFERFLQMLSKNLKSQCYRGVFMPPPEELCIAHVNNEIGRFFEGLRLLQKSIYASYIHHHPNPKIFLSHILHTILSGTAWMIF